MFRNLSLRVQDFFSYDVPEFFGRLNVIGRMRTAEAEAGQLLFQNLMLNATLSYGSRQYVRAEAALRDIHVACAAVATPNGTTKKIGRLAGTALAELREGVRG